MDEDFTEELDAAIPKSRDPDCDSDDGYDSKDTGNRQDWDPHAGMKPSHLDGCMSDDEVDLEDDLPYGADIEVNGPMIDFMLEHGNEDLDDLNWLPSGEPQSWNKESLKA
jgi:hypothetical protein